MSMLLDFIIIGLSLGLVYGLVALGVSLIYSGLDIVHFAHGEFFMFGAFFGMVILRDGGLSYPLTLFLAIIITGLMGVIVERLFYRRLTRDVDSSHGRFMSRGASMTRPTIPTMRAALHGGVRKEGYYSGSREC